jgi:octaprenyl-diphosphate synthase
MTPDMQGNFQEELTQVNAYIQKSLQSEGSLLQQLITHIPQQQGKQIRPQLTLLVAGILSGKITDKVRRGAALVSLLHYASLIHDDVVDEASTRRYLPTVNAQWGNKVAVLWGDYVLASMLRMIAANKDYEYMDMLVTTAQAMAAGEIMQLQQVQAGECKEGAYLQIIQKKTASLMAASCALGAIAVDASSEQMNLAYQIGEQLGMAFQLADDLIDYDNYAHTGKAAFMDLKAQQFTLPLIYSLQNASLSEVQYIKRMIKEATHDASALQAVLQFASQWGGIAYTQQKVSFYYQQTLKLLDAYFPPSDYTAALVSLIEQVLPSNYR